jgi:hypothetical protein
MSVHYGLAMGWCLAHPVTTTALDTGPAMSLIADEGLTPALGFSASNRAYPK